MNIFSKNVAIVTDVLGKSTAGIAGCGGLGSNIAVLLTRAGIGKIILLDFDRVEASNLNRQHYFIDSIGKYKVEELEKQLLNINPKLKIEKHNYFFKDEHDIKIFGNADLLFEAFDRKESKASLTNIWLNYCKKPIFCGNGMASYGKSSEISVHKMGRVTLCGDNKRDSSLLFTASRVMLVAALQVNEGIEYLVNTFS